MNTSSFVLTNRQKMIVIFIIISLSILIWQIKALMDSNNTSSTASEFRKENQLMNAPIQKPLEVSLKNNVEKVTLPQSGLQSTSNNTQMDAVQQKYLSLVNEYQVVEMERLIAQDEAAIAQSRASQAESLQKMNQIVGSSNNGDSGLDAMRSRSSESGSSSDYELIYTGEDNHQWTATLKKQGQFNDVTAGSVLPDGTKVLSVDDNGVLVTDARGARKLITFNGVDPVSEGSSQNESDELSPPVEKTPKAQPAPVANDAVPQKSQPKKAVEVLPKAPPVKAVSSQPVQTVVQKKVEEKKSVQSPPLQKPIDITKADKNAYTVQLIKGGNYQEISDLIKDNHLINNSQIVKLKKIYVGVYGIFPNAKIAQNALNQLPEEIREDGAFIRKLSEIQSQMEKTSE